jgi:hypothetical protein
MSLEILTEDMAKKNISTRRQKGEESFTDIGDRSHVVWILIRGWTFSDNGIHLFGEQRFGKVAKVLLEQDRRQIRIAERM